MSAKLRIDVHQGLIDVEGEETFVKLIYADFKEQLIEQFGRQKENNGAGEEQHVERGASINAPHSPKVSSRKSDGNKSKIAYEPRFDPNLDLGKLEEFYSQFDLKKHSEKILVFAMFMRDRLKKSPCTADEIYSCYFTVRDQTEIPEAFIQALRDTWNKMKWIHYVSPSEIKITTAGENQFKKLAKKGSAK